MSLDSVLTQVAAVQTTIPGVARAYDKAPASLKEYPSFINWGDRGAIERVPNMQISKHHIKMQLFVIKAEQTQAETVLRPFIDSTMRVFNRNLTLNGACANCLITGYEYGVMTYGGEQWLGASFDLDAIEWITQNFASTPAWTLADSVTNPDGGWTDLALASDNDISTLAYTTFAPGWSNYLYLNLAGLYCTQVKYHVNTAHLTTQVDQMQIDVYADGAWVSVYSGTTVGLMNTWITKTVSGYITQARVRAHNASVLTREFSVDEFQFYG